MLIILRLGRVYLRLRGYFWDLLCHRNFFRASKAMNVLLNTIRGEVRFTTRYYTIAGIFDLFGPFF